MIRCPPRRTWCRLLRRAAGFIATSTSAASPGVAIAWSAKCSWKALTPCTVPAGARISAGKSGSVDRSLPNDGSLLGEPVPGELHAVPGVAGEADDDLVEGNNRLAHGPRLSRPGGTSVRGRSGLRCLWSGVPCLHSGPSQTVLLGTPPGIASGISPPGPPAGSADQISGGGGRTEARWFRAVITAAAELPSDCPSAVPDPTSATWAAALERTWVMAAAMDRTLIARVSSGASVARAVRFASNWSRVGWAVAQC